MMKSSSFSIALLAAGTVLAACGGERRATPMLPTASDASTRALAGGYKLLYSFKGGKDGWSPQADLTLVGGMLYGTTYYGGDASCRTTIACGTLFQITPSGKHTVLHAFTGYPDDGAFPEAGVIAVNGKLYGTTTEGGTSLSALYGTVFESSTSGQEKVLHSFSTYGDGRAPAADLLEHNGVLFGTTSSGGYGPCYRSGSYCGTVFSSTLAGKEKVLYAFHGRHAPKDGGVPRAGLTLLGQHFYGTTEYEAADGVGAVFEVSTAGRERVLHSFTGQHDGAYPLASLTVLNGNLYGTTVGGGAYGLGSIYEISVSGNERVLYSFRGSPNDAAFPYGSLILVNGQFYGTTLGGGAHTCSASGTGCGTVFTVSPSGKEKLLYSFAGGTDGAIPDAALVNVNGTFYGVTEYGGSGTCPTYSSPPGCGTVFAVTP